MMMRSFVECLLVTYNVVIHQELQYIYTKTRPCMYTENFLVVKMKSFTGKILIFFLFLLKTEAVLTSTHILCFGAKIRKIGIPLQTPVLPYNPSFTI